MKFKSYKKEFLGDMITPVSLFLMIREKYNQVLLLESSDYASKEDSLSFICFDSLSSFVLHNNVLSVNGEIQEYDDVVDSLEGFVADLTGKKDSISPFDGVFGYSGFDAIPYFENITFKQKVNENDIPTIRYDFYRFVCVFDHFHNIIIILENCPEKEASKIESFFSLIKNRNYQSFDFAEEQEEAVNMTGDEYKDLVTRAKAHSQRGDTFQMVLSRQFKQAFSGDDFNLYRSLRSINPSPYLFYFEYGDFRIFGSSPEAQLKIKDRVAEIHPIAGTFKRTNSLAKDQALAKELLNDPKENAEHVMLVDLARNDLSKNCNKVEVTAYKQVQFFSHVIHLVSIVIGKLKASVSPIRIFADTFPAGTLSGAPKYKALQLINEYEPTQRTFYGGALGIIHFNGDLNHAIIIRSFLSKEQKLYYQAGAGIVIDSKEESELQEVDNKLGALRKAIANAQNI